MSATPTFTHVGRRASTGHYAVTADAHRTPGRTHALNIAGGGQGYIALCGVRVAEENGDHFLGRNPVGPAGTGVRVTCRRCRKKLDRSGVAPGTEVPHA